MRMIQRLLILVACAPVLYLGYCATHIPGGGDVEAANEVAMIISEGFGKFDNRQQVERTGKGKIWYVAPAVGPKPTFIVYEVTKPEEVAEIERLANMALVKVPSVQAITLKFYEKQNISIHESGAASRGWESSFKSETISRAP